MAEEKVQEEPKSAGGAGGAETVIAEFKAAQKRRRWILRFVVIAILTVVGIGVYKYYSYGKGLVQDVRGPEALKVVHDWVSGTAVPTAKTEGKRLYENLRPQVVQMARQKADEAGPRLKAAFEREQAIFRTNVRQMTREKGSAFLATIIKEHKDTLQAEFPDMSDPAKMEALINLLVEATRDVAVKVFLDKRLDPHLKVIGAMDEKVKMLPVSDPSLSDKELFERAREIAWDLWGLKTSKVGAGESATPSAAQ